jgi:hypothetical protein
MGTRKTSSCPSGWLSLRKPTKTAGSEGAWRLENYHIESRINHDMNVKGLGFYCLREEAKG